MHGQAVITSRRRMSGGLFDFSDGSVHPALHRPERTGMAEMVAE